MSQLLEQPERLAQALQQFRQSGVPDAIPWIISEYGFSSLAGRSLVEVPSALLSADIVGQFLTTRRQDRLSVRLRAEPAKQRPRRLRRLWSIDAVRGRSETSGTLADANLFRSAPDDPRLDATRELMAPALYRQLGHEDGSGRQIVTAYAVKRPDRKWAIMLVNKDPDRAYSVRVSFVAGQSSGQTFRSRIDVFQYSSEQYAWKAAGEDGRPIRTEPPFHFALAVTASSIFRPFR